MISGGVYHFAQSTCSFIISHDHSKPIDNWDNKRVAILGRRRRTLSCGSIKFWGKMPKKRKLKPDERFVRVTDEQLAKKRKDLKNNNTEKADRKAEKCFLQYLSLSNLDDLDYWDFEQSFLDEILCKFWFEVRSVEGERYRVSSLQNMRYALNRCIQKRDKDFDIIKSAAFVKSQRAFKDAVTELKSLGLGYVKSYPEIAPKGLYFLSKITHFDETKAR